MLPTTPISMRRAPITALNFELGLDLRVLSLYNPGSVLQEVTNSVSFLSILVLMLSRFVFMRSQ